MTSFNLVLDNAQAEKALATLEANGGDLSRPMEAIAELARSSIVRNFQVGGRYSEPGSLKGGTKKWKEKADGTPSILTQSTQLRDSIHPQSDRDSATIAASAEYAAIHNFGGQTGRGRKVKMPARPFMVIQESDVENAKDILVRHLLPP